MTKWRWGRGHWRRTGNPREPGTHGTGNPKGTPGAAPLDCEWIDGLKHVLGAGWGSYCASISNNFVEIHGAKLELQHFRYVSNLLTARIHLLMQKRTQRDQKHVDEVATPMHIITN